MLSQILESVEAGLPGLRSRTEELRAAAEVAVPPRRFVEALAGQGLSVLAEVKRRSPSRGVIHAGLDPVALARDYQSGGAAAISVLTESAHFDGSLDDLRDIRAAVDVPVLRKDFIVDEAQVWEARAAGADSILLIVAALTGERLDELLALSRSVGMEPLVEVHDAREADVAVAAGADVIGVNNRDLATFDVDLRTAESLRGRLGDVVTVAESGIWTRRDAQRMRNAGYDAVLVGESLVRSGDPAGAIASWIAAT